MTGSLRAHAEPAVVSLTAAQARLARYAVGDVIARRKLGNQPVPAGLPALDTYLTSSVDGTKTCVAQPQSAPSAAEELIDSTTAAAILNCSTSWIRRIRQQLDGCQIAGRWLFPRETVIDYAARKAGQNR